MMILRGLPASPFARKCRIAAGVLGLDRDLEMQAADTNNASDTVRQQNPLGKIPVLVAEDGETYFDSRVIVDYLDQRAGGGKIIPRDSKARLKVMRLQALCDGILDAAILQIYEGRWRPEDMHVKKWTDYQAGKVERALAALEADPPGLDATPHIGQIATACVLGYHDFRFHGHWRQDHPNLVRWLDAFAAAVPAYAATTPTG